MNYKRITITTLICLIFYAHHIMPRSGELSSDSGRPQNHIEAPSNTKECWLELLKKHGWSAIIGSLLGTISGIATATTNSLFERNELNNLNFFMFITMKCIVLHTIAQDAKHYKLDFNFRTSLTALLMSNLTVYSLCTK